MKKQMIYLLFGLFLISCNHSDKLLREIEHRESEMRAQEGTPKDNKKDNYLLIETYEDFLKDYPKHKEAAAIEHKLAQAWIKMRKFDQACQHLGNIYNNYPNYDRKVEALFLKAFLCETELSRKKEAMEIYKKIAQDHPNHDLAKDAKIMSEMK